MQLDDGDIAERLLRLDTGQLSDVLDEAGLPNCVLSGDLAPVTAESRFVGVALTVRGEPLVRTREPRRPTVAPDAVDRALAPGSVLVMDTGGFTAGACLGGLMAYSYARAGCRGVVVDGLVRDVAEIGGLGLPVRARGTTPVNSARRWSLVEVGRTVELPGASGPRVTIATGDFIVSDADGCVVVPRGAARSIVEDTERLAQAERAIEAAMKAGADRLDAFAKNPRFDHIRRAVTES